MGIFEIISAIVLIIACVFIVIVVLMQDTKTQMSQTISGNTGDYHMTRMVAAILISFGCYLPVTLFSKTKPKVGLLMIPKTCAYVWTVLIGFNSLRNADRNESEADR